jgi:hypothetical protein
LCASTLADCSLLWNLKRGNQTLASWVSSSG